MNKGETKFLIQEFKNGLNVEKVLDHISKHYFVIFELDEDTINTQCMQRILDKIKISYLKRELSNEFKLVFIINQIGDVEFKNRFKRDDSHVWPEALDYIQLANLGLLENVKKIRSFTKESFKKCIHIKVILREETRK